MGSRRARGYREVGGQVWTNCREPFQWSSCGGDDIEPEGYTENECDDFKSDMFHPDARIVKMRLQKIVISARVRTTWLF